MASLGALIGQEHDLAHVAGALRQVAYESGAVAVGAHQVCCSDETERQVAEAFDRGFVRELLPALEPERRAAFRSVNLGARYEWGSVRIAEAHYATGASQPASNLLVLKINAHVGLRTIGGEPEYGVLSRYGCDSPCCGALAAMFTGVQLPAVEELRQAFDGGGARRLETLSDPDIVPPEYRALLAAVTQAWLQARRAVEDINQYRPEWPTAFLVLPCVTINRTDGPDTELVVGQYAVDHTGDAADIRYQGLGGDPARYRVRHERGRLIVDEA